MIRRLFLVLATVAFVAWIGWLAFAVSRAGTVPIVSRAQLTAASHLLVLDVGLEGDLPKTKGAVLEVVSGDGLKPGDEIGCQTWPLSCRVENRSLNQVLS